MTDDAPIDLAALGVRRAGANPDVRDLIRDMSMKAEEGRALAVGVVLVLDDGAIATAFVTGDRWSALLGGAATLQARITAQGMEP